MPHFSHTSARLCKQLLTLLFLGATIRTIFWARPGYPGRMQPIPTQKPCVVADGNKASECVHSGPSANMLAQTDLNKILYSSRTVVFSRRLDQRGRVARPSHDPRRLRQVGWGHANTRPPAPALAEFIWAARSHARMWLPPTHARA